VFFYHTGVAKTIEEQNRLEKIMQRQQRRRWRWGRGGAGLATLTERQLAFSFVFTLSPLFP